MVRIFAVSGSLRAVSTNTALIHRYSERSPQGCEVDVYNQLAELPHFNSDIEDSMDTSVLDLVSRVRKADAFVVSTPEYAHGMPGSLKNCLDWLVRTDAFIEKPFALLTACPRSKYAPAALIEVLQTMSGIHVTDADIIVDLKRTPDKTPEILTDPTVTGRIDKAISVLVEFCTTI